MDRNQLRGKVAAGRDIVPWRSGAPRSTKMGTYMRPHESRGFSQDFHFLPSQEGLCLHSRHDSPVAWPCFLGQAPAPAGLRLWAQGLDGESTRRAIMV